MRWFRTTLVDEDDIDYEAQKAEVTRLAKEMDELAAVLSEKAKALLLQIGHDDGG